MADRPESQLKLLTQDSPERKKEITEDVLVEFFKQTYNQFEETRKPIISKCDDAWNVYNNYYDFSDKAKWQSKNYIPKFKMAVRTASAVLKRALLQSQKFFVIEGLNDESRLLEKDIEEGMERLLDQSDFQLKLIEAITGGLLENLINLKIFPMQLSERDRPISENQTHKLVVQPVTTYNLWLDPSGRGRGLIHKVVMDLADYAKLVDARVYEKSSFEYVQEDYRNKEYEYREKIRQGVSDVRKPTWRKEVELMEYWGDVDDEYGNRLFENVTFTIVNMKKVARYPIKNPYRHGKPPFVIGPIIKKPYSVWHEGFGDGVVPISKMMVENLNTTLDGNLFATARAFELNLDYVHDPTEYKAGIYPGKVFKTRGVPPGTRAINDITIGGSSREGLMILAALDREFQNGTGINEYISGFAGMGAKSTATEVRQKSSQSASLITEIASDIEQRVLDPSIEMGVDLMLEWNPEIFGDRILQVPASKLKFRYKARGMSQVLAKSEEAQKALMFLNIIGKTPLVNMVNWREIGKMVVSAMNWNPEKILPGISTSASNEPGQTTPRPEEEKPGLPPQPLQFGKPQ